MSKDTKTEQALDHLQSLRDQAIYCENCRVDWEKSKADTSMKKKLYDEAMDEYRNLGISDMRQAKLPFEAESA